MCLDWCLEQCRHMQFDVGSAVQAAIPHYLVGALGPAVGRGVLLLRRPRKAGCLRALRWTITAALGRRRRAVWRLVLRHAGPWVPTLRRAEPWSWWPSEALLRRPQRRRAPGRATVAAGTPLR